MQGTGQPAGVCMGGTTSSTSTWAEWATGFGGLRFFSGGRNSNGNDTAERRRSSGAGDGMSSLQNASSAGVLSPLGRDTRQQNLLHQQHWKEHEVAHQQHVQAQHALQDSTLTPHTQHNVIYTLEQQQQLPAAVGSFQHHKLMRADSLFGSSSGKGGSGKLQLQGSLQSQGSGSWSPTWLLRSFVPFGSPTASDAEARTAGADGDCAAGQQQRGSWSMLGACSVRDSRDAWRLCSLRVQIAVHTSAGAVRSSICSMCRLCGLPQ